MKTRSSDILEGPGWANVRALYKQTDILRKN